MTNTEAVDGQQVHGPTIGYSAHHEQQVEHPDSGQCFAITTSLASDKDSVMEHTENLAEVSLGQPRGQEVIHGVTIIPARYSQVIRAFVFQLSTSFRAVHETGFYFHCLFAFHR